MPPASPSCRPATDSTLEASKEELAAARRLRYTTDLEMLRDRHVYIVTVPTPIDNAKRPDLGALISASRTVGKVLKKGDIVVYESTVYPGATEEDCAPILEQVSGPEAEPDFFVGYSPERINPGDKEHRLTTIRKITAGSTPEAGHFIDRLYGSIITAGTYPASSIRVAEAAKVIENTQRDVNIALINELALIFNRMGLDTLEVLEAAGTKWNFLPFRPGLVGGHCIGVDPYYLTHKSQQIGYHPEMILAGRRINDNMGLYVASEVVKLMVRKGMSLPKSRILVLGFTFKENCPGRPQHPGRGPDPGVARVRFGRGDLRSVGRPARGARGVRPRPPAPASGAGYLRRRRSGSGPPPVPRDGRQGHTRARQDGSRALRHQEPAARRPGRCAAVSRAAAGLPMKILVTGAAGFIGMFVSRLLLARGDEVVGLDNLNEYYDVNLKKSRLALLQKMPGFRFVRLDLADRAGMERLFREQRFERVVHLAAQAGVRYSLINPHAYIDSNLVGTFHLLEGCRAAGVEHVVYASTSSVYGANTRMPFSPHRAADHPISLYAATKKANEMMAHSYSMLHRLPTTGLRFFTVYGPFGRPDMALFQFTRNILEGKPIDVFNFGKHRRDFTYVDDIAEGVVRSLDRVAAPDPRLGFRRSGSGIQLGPLPALQHRQQPAGRADALHRGARESPGPQGREESAADAAGRRAGHLRRRR